MRLAEIVEERTTDPGIQMMVFASATPDFIHNHFDLAAVADFLAPEDENTAPLWTDVVLKLSRAPYVTVAVIRGRTRGSGNALGLALDLRYASRENAIFGEPEARLWEGRPSAARGLFICAVIGFLTMCV